MFENKVTLYLVIINFKKALQNDSIENKIYDFLVSDSTQIMKREESEIVYKNYEYHQIMLVISPGTRPKVRPQFYKT